MVVYKLSHPPMLGFETARINANPYLYKKNNLLKVLSYFPVISLVTGSMRFSNTLTSLPSRSNKVTHIVRGIFECLGLGSLFLIPDIAITIQREKRCSFYRETKEFEMMEL